MKKSVFVCIDVSKLSLDAAMFEPSSGTLTHQQFKNNDQGFAKLLKWVVNVASLQDCLFCTEDSGSYSYRLVCFLTNAEADLCQESAYRIKHSMGIQRGKTDKADAEMIARFAYRFADELSLYTPPVTTVAQLKALLSFRLRLIKQKTSIISAIEIGKHHMVVINAIRNKLISRMFAVIRRDTPYVKLQL
ncbi:transposase [Catalinimonas sp. 4WD22]|uniref:IS110 family transposase n=1 Tax=Catalinimonas locisalis TaxID=3133978 RepID=UPI0031015369